MEENYIIAFREVSKRFSRSNKLFYFYVSALYGLLCKYSDYKKIVLQVFRKCDFYLEEGSIGDILERHNINNSEYDEDYIDSNDVNTTYGVSNQGHEFFINENGEVSKRINKPFIACSITGVSLESLLNTFCHEMGHLIKGEVNGYEVDEDSKKIDYEIRTGFAYYYYSYEKEEDTLSSGCEFSVFDEAINVIQTSEVMREILTLKDISIDSELSEFIFSLDEDELVRDRGYEGVVELVRLLWSNTCFRYLVDESIVTRGIDTLMEFFDEVLGEEILFELAEKIDEFFDVIDSDGQDDLFDKYRDEIISMIEQFNNNSKKMLKGKILL